MLAVLLPMMSADALLSELGKQAPSCGAFQKPEKSFDSSELPLHCMPSAIWGNVLCRLPGLLSRHGTSCRLLEMQSMWVGSTIAHA